MVSKPPSQPSAPSPRATAEANVEANAFTQLTPTGNVLYGQIDPRTGEFVEGGLPTIEQNRIRAQNKDAKFQNAVRIEETPFQEQARSLQESLALGLLGGFGAELPPGASGDPSERSQQVSDQLFETNLERLTPEFDRQRSQLEQSLADQGIPIGSKAYNDAINQFEQSKGDTLNQLALQSTLAGSQEQSRIFSQEEALRNNRLREIASVLGQQTLSGANVTPQIPFTDITGLTAQNFAAQTNQFNQKVAARNSRNQALGSVGGAVLGSMIGGPAGGAAGLSFGGLF